MSPTELTDSAAHANYQVLPESLALNTAVRLRAQDADSAEPASAAEIEKLKAREM